LTDQGLEKLRNAFIIVVGCGGVGSHAAAALTRSGVSKLRLIDFDQVTLSSLNRHAVATLADVGTPKVHAIRKRLEAIAPWVHFDCRNELFSGSTAHSQLGPLNDEQPPDYVIDAIDNIDSKVALLRYCYENKIKVISSMGAGAKSDPTKIFVGDISASTEDPLSRSTRVRLRGMGIKEGIPVVFSTERPGPGKAELVPLSEDEFEKGNIGELGVLQNFRVRIMPVLGTMPAIFGLATANHVMLEISGYPHENVQSKSNEKRYAAMASEFLGQETRLAKRMGLEPTGLKTQLTADDIGLIVEEVYRGRSVLSGLVSRLAVVRWTIPSSDFFDTSVPGQKVSRANMEDVVCMTKEEAQRHEELVLKGNTPVEELYDEAILEKIRQRLKTQRELQRYR
jgi:tRNA threonylcarbamoyladenosine dehydratase